MKYLFLSLLVFSYTICSLEFLFDDYEYSFQTLRSLAATTGGAADIGECLTACKKITDGNDESWLKAWTELAERIESSAHTWMKKGHIISARSAFMRASQYYRTSGFFLTANPKDPRIGKAWKKSKACFLDAIRGAKPSIYPVRIPFERTYLPGYFCKPATTTSKKCPLIIIQTGFDGTAEELYYSIGHAAVSRGYACLLFEGPGQGGVIRELKIPFRPNWETVITPVVDFAQSLEGVDTKKIALMGISLGGYLVPRALAFEKRISLGIVNGGVYDFHEVCMRNAPSDFEARLDDPQACKEINASLEQEMKTNVDLRWAVGNGMFTFQAKSPTDWLRMTRAYTLKDIVKDIKCHMIVIDSEHDFMMQGQSKKLYDALSCPKEFIYFSAAEGAGEHCQVGAYDISNERVFNAIDAFFK
jgi:predicted alpha/beta-fold hydrolase